MPPPEDDERMTPESRTVEVDIMTLFNTINQKLDALPAQIALKADSLSLERLSDKLRGIEVNGTRESQEASAGVNDLKEKISALGWKVAIALATALLAGGGTVFIGLKH